MPPALTAHDKYIFLFRIWQFIMYNNSSGDFLFMIMKCRNANTIYALIRTSSCKFLASIILLLAVLVLPWSPPAVLAAGTSEPVLDTASESADQTGETVLPSSTTIPASSSQTVFLDPDAADNFDINGKAYVLYDVQSGVFLLGHNPDLQLSPASITKVMTIILTLEKLKLTDTITVTRDMYQTIPNDYVRLGLTDGETISVEEALYACLLISANDAATALALTMSDSVSDFAVMMNERAKELGCTGTHFTNPYGLAEADNLTTAHDMALIMAEALKSETYRRISTTEHHLIPATNMNGARGLTNGNRFVSTDKYAYPYYIGGKTGFTNLSGHTIAAGACKDGRTLIGVILGATASEIRYENLQTLFENGFSAYGNISLDPAAFDSTKTQVMAKAESQIQNAGLLYTIVKTDMTLNQFAAATQAHKSAGYTCSAGEAAETIAAGMTRQVIDYPLFIVYNDGSKSQVGVLSLTLQLSPTVTPASSTSTKPTDPTSPGGPTTGTLLLRIGGALLAAVLFLAAFIVMLVLLRVKSMKQRRMRRRKPNIRRL
jgi:serine-type D-Ala-D-Ala carboxypeptidase (penicillin-binding protein 5/6)